MTRTSWVPAAPTARAAARRSSSTARSQLGFFEPSTSTLPGRHHRNASSARPGVRLAYSVISLSVQTGQSYVSCVPHTAQRVTYCPSRHSGPSNCLNVGMRFSSPTNSHSGCAFSAVPSSVEPQNGVPRMNRSRSVAIALLPEEGFHLECQVVTRQPRGVGQTGVEHDLGQLGLGQLSEPALVAPPA